MWPQLRSVAWRIYRRCTPSTIPRTVVAILGLFMFLIAFAVISEGLVSGASAAIDGDPLDVQEVADVESELWTEMGETSPVGRSVYGFMHWFFALVLWGALLGMELGYAVPVLGRVVGWTSTAMMWFVVVLAALQLIRLAEVTIRAGGDSRPSREQEGAR